KLYSRNIQILQNLRRNFIFSLIWRKAERFIRFDRIQSLILQTVCTQFVQEADPPSFLAHINDCPASPLIDHLQRFVQLRPAVATDRMEHIASQTFRMDAYERCRLTSW